MTSSDTIPNRALPTDDDLAGLSVLFGFLARTFYDDPDRALLDGLAAEPALFDEAPFSTAAPQGARALRATLEAHAGDPDASFDEVKQDRALLFYMVGYSRTSPYESVYRTDDHTMFGSTTSRVKETYRHWDVGGLRTPNEPVDHFGLECAFVARMAEVALEARAAGDEEHAGAAVEAARAMLADHLLVFGPVYAENVQKRAHHAFYQACGLVAAEALTAASALLDAQASEELNPQLFTIGS